jgi:hypothetical protein
VQRGRGGNKSASLAMRQNDVSIGILWMEGPTVDEIDGVILYIAPQ